MFRNTKIVKLVKFVKTLPEVLKQRTKLSKNCSPWNPIDKVFDNIEFNFVTMVWRD